MIETKPQIVDNKKTLLAASLGLFILSFAFFNGLTRSEPWILLALFMFNSFMVAFANKKTLETSDPFIWGVGLNGLKSFLLFIVLGFICFFDLVEEVDKFVAFFGLGFIGLMVLEVKYIYKEFGKKE